MNISFNTLLQKDSFTKDEIVRLLKASGEQEKALFKRSHDVKLKHIGNKVYFRGLVEFSNIYKVVNVLILPLLIESVTS